jgi:hypothetical protein
VPGQAIAFIDGFSSGGNVISLTPAWPGSQSASDFALLWWTFQSTATPTNPTGFTQVATNNTASGAGTSRLFSRALDGTEGTGTITLSAPVSAAAERQSAVLAIYRGVDSIDQFAWRAETTAGTTHANPQVTTVAANCGIVTAVLERATTGTNGWTAPTGYTEREDTTTQATGSGGTITACADLSTGVLLTPFAAGSAVTPPVWTSANAFSTANVGSWTVSLKPRIVPALYRMVGQSVNRAGNF